MNLLDIARMTDTEAEEMMLRARWPEGPTCIRCGCIDCYRYESRKIYKCRVCTKQFSLTSGTVFASRKMTLTNYLFFVAMMAHSAKGVSSLQLARHMGIQQRTAHGLQHKLRQRILDTQRDVRLFGEVEVDGAFFGGYRYASPTVRTQGGKRFYMRRGLRKVVVVARQRGGRCRTFVVDRESEAVFALKGCIDANAIIHTDGAHAWDSLEQLYSLLRIHHSVSYSDGIACTNQAESFFSRLRRIHLGTYHRLGGNNLPLFAAEAAWYEDNRNLSADERMRGLLRIVLSAPEKTNGVSTRRMDRRNATAGGYCVHTTSAIRAGDLEEVRRPVTARRSEGRGVR